MPYDRFDLASMLASGDIKKISRAVDILAVKKFHENDNLPQPRLYARKPFELPLARPQAPASRSNAPITMYKPPTPFSC